MKRIRTQILVAAKSNEDKILFWEVEFLIDPSQQTNNSSKLGLNNVWTRTMLEKCSRSERGH